jgi:hypothetical protein
MIKILCDEEKAAMLFDSATRIYPEAIAASAARSSYTRELYGRRSTVQKRPANVNSERFGTRVLEAPEWATAKSSNPQSCKSSWLLWRAKFR